MELMSVWKAPLFPLKRSRTSTAGWGMDVIGMTNLQEAKLAREAEICYVTMALVTDYDCWHESHESVTVEMIVDNLQQNSSNAQRIIRETLRTLPGERQLRVWAQRSGTR